MDAHSCYATWRIIRFAARHSKFWWSFICAGVIISELLAKTKSHFNLTYNKRVGECLCVYRLPQWGSQKWRLTQVTVQWKITVGRFWFRVDGNLCYQFMNLKDTLGLAAAAVSCTTVFLYWWNEGIMAMLFPYVITKLNKYLWWKVKILETRSCN